MKNSLNKYLVLFFFFCAGVSTAQIYFFGRNKVQYEEFDWKILKTEHFNIYYYNQTEEIAEIGAKYAEEAYEHLKVKFNHVVTRKIPLIFYNTHIHFQQTNISPGLIPEGVGGFFEFLKGRVVIPYRGNLAEFRHVIRHELVHVFMTNKIVLDARDRRSTKTNFPPLWFIEGLAEFWSTEWDTQAEMIMRDAVLNDIFANLENINRIYGSFLMYKEGQNFLEFVKSEYGEDKVLMLLDNIWRFSNFYDVIEYTLGEQIEQIDAKWLYALKKEYFPLMATNKPHFVGAGKITETGFNFSPNYVKINDKGYIYFISNRDGYTSIYRLEVDDDRRPVSSPEKIIQGEKTSEFEAFHLLNSDLSVSPQQLMAFVTKSNGSDVIHLYSLQEDMLIKTIRFDDIIAINAPKFSSDGKKLVFSGVDRKGFEDLFITEIEDESLIRLTNDYYQDMHPVWGENNNSIVFASDRTDGKFAQSMNLFKYNFTDNRITYLTYTNANFSSPRFSPDYKNLYFNSDYDGTFNIWKLEFNQAGMHPQGMTRYTNFITSIFDFTFINNDEIITSAFEKFSFQFYNMDLTTIPDSEKTFVEFDFADTGGKWKAEKLTAKTDFQRVEYEKDYNLDYAYGQITTGPVYGGRGGAFFTLSDMLSDDRYTFLIYNTAEVQSEVLKNFNVAITRINSEYRTNYAYGIFHFSGRRYDIRESDEYFYERNYGGFASLLYPFSTFDRLEATVSVSNSDRELRAEITGRKALLVSNTITYVHDNSIWGPTGPLDGSRFRFLLGYTNDVKYSNVNYYSLIADYRTYYRTSLYTALAFRAAVFYNEGKDARRYFAGGSWDLRGWKRWSIRGEKLWLASMEFRYPLLNNLILNFPFGAINFPLIRGAAFIDLGSAWDVKYDETLGSVGVGVRMNLFGIVVLRYDVGKKIEDDLSRFQPKLFYQFFIGWDF